MGSPRGTSCADIASRNGATASSGFYLIAHSSAPPVTVYCDFSSDGGIGYSYYACTNCVPFRNATSVPNGCTSVGLSHVVPRSQSHWAGMYAFVTTVLQAGMSTYFHVIPGVYKPTSGLTDCAPGGRGNLSAAGCAGTLATGGWRSVDGNPWWVRSAAYGEPSGDYYAGCFLSFGGASSDGSGVTFNDGDGGGPPCSSNTGPNYLCSTNDVWPGQLPAPQPPPSPFPPPPAPPLPPAVSSDSLALGVGLTSFYEAVRFACSLLLGSRDVPIQFTSPLSFL